MSDPMTPSPIPPVADGRSTTVIDPVDPPVVPASERPAAGVRDERGSDHHNPLDNITPEKPRNHPVAYVALATAALALILSLINMGSDDDGYRQVKVGAQDCVLGPAGDVDALYCRAPAAANP